MQLFKRDKISLQYSHLAQPYAFISFLSEDGQHKKAQDLVTIIQDGLIFILEDNKIRVGTMQDAFVQQFFVFDQSPVPNRRKGSVTIPNQCRICLQEEEIESGQTLISPCQCSGSVKYVHFSCMVRWIERNCSTPLEKLKNSGKYQCEMCKYKIDFECSKTIIVNRCEQFQQKVKLHRFTFCFLTIVILLCFGLICTGLALMSNPHFFSFASEFIFQSLVILVSTVLLLVLISISSYMMVIHFVMSVATSITKIQLPKFDSPRKQSTSSSFSCLQTEVSQMKRRLSRTNFPNLTVFPLEMVIENIE